MRSLFNLLSRYRFVAFDVLQVGWPTRNWRSRAPMCKPSRHHIRTVSNDGQATVCHSTSASTVDGRHRATWSRCAANGGDHKKRVDPSWTLRSLFYNLFVVNRALHIKLPVATDFRPSPWYRFSWLHLKSQHTGVSLIVLLPIRNSSVHNSVLKQIFRW